MNYKSYTHVYCRYFTDQIASVISECIKIAYIYIKITTLMYSTFLFKRK